MANQNPVTHYNLYLWIFPHNDKLVKIEHLSFEEALEYGTGWYNIDKNRDYLMNPESPDPFVTATDIQVKSKEWIKSYISNHSAKNDLEE